MIDYTTDKWYINTYNSLGSDWLINSLAKLDLKSNYVLVNLSANAGYYERDAYEYEVNREKAPTFYLSDLHGDELTDQRAIASIKPEGFVQIAGNTDARDFNTSEVKQPADIVVDIKGAMWYLFRESRDISKVKALLDKYISMLGDNGVLLIDAYKGLAIKGQFERLFGRKGKRKSKLNNFGECSTEYVLEKAFGEKISALGKLLNVCKVNRDYPLARSMNTFVYSKQDLVNMRNMLYAMNDKEGKKMFRRTSKSWLINKMSKIVRVALIIAIVLFIVAFVRLYVICNQRGISIWSIL